MKNWINNLIAAWKARRDEQARSDIRLAYKDGAVFPNAEYSQAEIERLFNKGVK